MILRIVLPSACRPQVEYVMAMQIDIPSLFNRVGVAGRYPCHARFGFLTGAKLGVDAINDLRLEGTRFHPQSKWRILEWERMFHR